MRPALVVTVIWPQAVCSPVRTRARAHARYRPGLIRIVDRDESPRSPIQICASMPRSSFTQYHPRSTHPYILEPLLAGLWLPRLHTSKRLRRNKFLAGQVYQEFEVYSNREDINSDVHSSPRLCVLNEATKRETRLESRGGRVNFRRAGCRGVFCPQRSALGPRVQVVYSP